MKKFIILLLILSMCGGTAETDLDYFEEVSLEAKEGISDAQEENQKENKESETAEEENQKENKESETAEEETTTTVLERKYFGVLLMRSLKFTQQKTSHRQLLI